ncbi:Hypothetical predicted protein [Olea europaea subsp. europaea]|uniref:Uncharacterized protein n=1 Tax=Olea europaea subsp. europaea TaxID=158383 RepID=A0A8S0QXU8_OLEEU|nr:Hypothetical predicted protein [Olea europaea subsp. europaea]
MPKNHMITTTTDIAPGTPLQIINTSPAPSKQPPQIPIVAKKKRHHLAIAIKRTAVHADVDRSTNHTTTINSEQQRNGSLTSKREKEKKGLKPSLAASRCCCKCPPLLKLKVASLSPLAPTHLLHRRLQSSKVSPVVKREGIDGDGKMFVMEWVEMIRDWN